ncbi:MAG: lysophospholipid acyltransferase family protein [Acidimicrobiia bacterium]
MIKDWFFSLITVVVFGITLVYYDIKGRLALRRGPRAFEEAMASLQKRLLGVFGISGVTVKVEGRDGFASEGGFIIVSNHQSMFDVPIFGGILTRNYPKYVAKSSLASGIPAISLNLKHGGNALIDRGDRQQAIEAIDEMGRTCQERDVSAVIFPEGTRSRDGSLAIYRRSGLAALMRSAPELPIVPAVIDGSWKVFDNNMLPVPYGTEVRIRFGAPIPRTSGESPRKVLDACHDFAETTLEAWH